MLYIRTDGNSRIMTGHVMRCLSIAKAARLLSVDTVFVLADSSMEEYIKTQGFRISSSAGSTLIASA